MADKAHAVLPRLAITMGDPGGVGPEVIIKALLRPDVSSMCRPVIVGSLSVMEEVASQLKADVRFVSVSDLANGIRAGSASKSSKPAFAVFTPPGTELKFRRGEVDAANGRASHDYIVAAARAALGGQVDALCTAPIAKEALFAAGSTVPGHTELLASLCGRDIVRMMLVGGGLRVVLQTIHVALTRVPAMLKAEDIITSLQIISNFAKMIGEASPRIAVCGLNPHAGEAGHFGDEEIRIIAPAIQLARNAGLDVSGPFPADTVFHRVLQQEFDFVLAMYHDQGLIPVKTLDFHGGVNVTLGLPLIRTSPDHGTAFGIAGQGIAHEGSMVAAIKYAAQIAKPTP
jgi:4-hydroxythreonine-4-phosphate dehydrogenase